MAYGQSWQEKLEAACRDWRIAIPIYQIVSDRRGGRTAWSARVTVYGSTHHAKFWYDGKNLRNAREDAAEVALKYLDNMLGTSSGSVGRSGW